MAAAFAAAPVLAGVLVATTAVAVGAGAFAAIRSAEAAEEQAEAEELRQQQLSIQGQQRANQILEEEIDAIAAVNVGAAASGVDPFTGSPAGTRRRIRERANRQLSTARTETAFGITQSRSLARQSRLQGQASLIGGLGGAASTAGTANTQLRAVG